MKRAQTSFATFVVAASAFVVLLGLLRLAHCSAAER